MSLRMAADLGDRVHLSSPVRFVAQDSGGVTVVSDTVVVNAERFVVAAPPAFPARIDFQPNLPQARDYYMQHSPQGQLCKVEAVYRTPFWRLGFVGGDSARQFAGYPDGMRDAVLANLVTYFGDATAADRCTCWAGAC